MACKLWPAKMWPANIGPQILARKFWPANIGPQILARKHWPANVGPQILARKYWPANFGQQILARKNLARRYWPANFGPQKCGPQILACKNVARSPQNSSSPQSDPYVSFLLRQATQKWCSNIVQSDGCWWDSDIGHLERGTHVTPWYVGSKVIQGVIWVFWMFPLVLLIKAPNTEKKVMEFLFKTIKVMESHGNVMRFFCSESVTTLILPSCIIYMDYGLFKVAV